MVVDQRNQGAYGKANSEPNRLSFNEKIDIAMTVSRKRARAKKHDDTDHQQPQHRQKEDVSALTVHNQLGGENRRSRRRPPLQLACVSFFLLVCACRLGWNEQLLSDLQFARVLDVIEANQIVVGDF